MYLREVKRTAVNSDIARKTRSQTRNFNAKIGGNKENSIHSTSVKKSVRNFEKKDILKATEIYSVRTTRFQTRKLSAKKIEEKKQCSSLSSKLIEKKDTLKPAEVCSKRETRSQTQNFNAKKIEEKNTVKTGDRNAHAERKNIIKKRAQFFQLKEYEVNSIVLAKQAYSQPWPARILKIAKKRIRVYFYGDRREGFVASHEIYDFQKSKEALKLVIKSKGQKTDGYLTGIREIEFLLNIPFEQSILNEI